MKPQRLVVFFLEENRTEPQIREDSSGQIQVLIGFDMSWQKLEMVMTGLVTDDELETARQIWTNDECERHYEVTEKGLKITISV